MPISSQTKDALNQLALSMIQETEEPSLADISLTGGFRQGAFPERLRDAAGEETLILTGDDLRLYSQACAALSQEKEMEHLSIKDVDDELWDFACKLFVHREKYEDDRARARAVRELVSRLHKPWQDYEIMAVVDNLKLTVHELDVIGVKIRYLSRQSVLAWGFGSSRWPEEYANEFIRRAVAIAEETAGSPQRAAERAICKIDDALHALRTALVGSMKASILDEQILFKRGRLLAVKQANTNEIKFVQGRRLFGPLGFDIRRNTAELARKYLASINPIIAGSFPPAIQNQLRRALHWIGTSITRESYDDKVVDLCTALEALLTVKADPRKGEAIALRIMLLPSALGEGFFSPIEAYELYELRSRVIHGSDLRACGRRDYWHLLSLAVVMVGLFVDLVSQDKSITTPAKLISAIEAPDLLSQAISWLERIKSRSSRDIANFARARLPQ